MFLSFQEGGLSQTIGLPTYGLLRSGCTRRIASGRIVVDGKSFKTLNSCIGNTVATQSIFEGLVFTGQASIFVGEAVGLHSAFQTVEALVHFAAAILLILENAVLHSCTSIFLLKGFKLNLGIDEAAL